MKEYTLYMKRDEGLVMDSLGSFGFAVTSLEWPDEETCDVATREWPGLDGEDAYVPPSGLTLKAYDLAIEFCFKSASAPQTIADARAVRPYQEGEAYSAYKAFRDWLRGGMLMVYDPYWKKGRKGCYAKKFSDLEPHRDNVGEVLCFTLTLRVTDPATEIVAALDEDGEVYNIGAEAEVSGLRLQASGATQNNAGPRTHGPCVPTDETEGEES